MIMKKSCSYLLKLSFFKKGLPPELVIYRKELEMSIPFFTIAGFASSSSELVSSELDSSFFAGGFLAGVAEISQ